MSSHRLDVSGARPLTTTLNDPAATIAQTGAKAGDDVNVILGGLREIRLAIGDGARIERRQYVRRTAITKNGVHVKVDDEYQYEEKPYEMLVLVLAGSVTVFGRASILPDAEVEEGAKVYEGTPHTTVTARRVPELSFLESGTLLEQFSVGGLIEVTQRVVDAGKVSE